MMKTLVFFIVLLPISCLAQFTITGRVFNQADKKPVPNASVFLSNSSVGNKTADDGTFKLTHAKPGKYELVVSSVGFETYRQSITVNDNVTLADIEIKPQTILLNEVSIKPVIDPNREKYLLWFTEEFLGFSATAGECKIVNPEILDFDYDEKNSVLKASTSDFLEIENDALGYKIKYLITDFKLDNGPAAKFHLNYQGSVLFEAMKGTSSEEQRWQKHRQEAYEGSLMHFLRSVLNDDITQEHFRALLIKRQANPARPNDSLIEAKIKFYQKSKGAGINDKDSLSFWTRKKKLPKIIESMSATPLHKDDIIKPTNQQGLFALSPGSISNSFFISYNEGGHFYLNSKPTQLQMDDFRNNENTKVDFAADYAFFDSNGWVTNPNSLVFSGVWARHRVAELLPVDYEPSDDEIARQDSTFSNKIVAGLNKYNTTHITEKAYLQFDKPYYAAGDTIYFKAYITKGPRHELSDLSGVLHVDFINTNSKIDQTIKLQLDTGVAWGDFALPDSLPKGNYRVRAYTQWMKNDSTSNFFEKIIPVGSLTNSPMTENISKQPVQKITNKADIQFFPEGGSLVAGIRSKIAFKAIGADGLGINVKGRIIDNKNNEITSFTSMRLGMGYFYLMPEEGKTYKAQLSFAGGAQSTIDLPAADTKGVVLSINNDEIPKATVRIRANKAYFRENKDKDFTFLIYSGGEATTVVRTLDSATVSFDILKRHLQTGIATITLFSPSGEPLAERLLFIQNYSQLNLGINTDKAAYTKREKVNIALKVTNRSGNPSSGHFSVSVTDESKVPENGHNENTILSYLLLTSDLKGYVEQPSDYFTDTTANAAKNLDILMLTQGYRHFTWKQVLDNGNQPMAYRPEKALEISGTVKSLLGKPIAGGTVNLIQPKGGALLSSITDDKGIFRFSNLIYNDTTHFVLSAVNAKGKNSTKITLFNEKPEPVIPATQFQNVRTVSDTGMTAYLENTKNSRNELVNYGIKGKLLKEVEIKAKKEPEQRSQSFIAEFAADQVIQGKDILYGGPLSVRLMGLVHGAHFMPSGGNSFAPINNITMLPLLILVDGQPGNIDDVSTDRVSSIYVIKPPNSYVYGKDGLNGVLIINTKLPSAAAEDMSSIGILPITPIGFYKAREFYSPKYDSPTLPAKQHDLRSTIYWKPEIVTDKDGNASFEYYNADGTGTYRVVIEGIDDKGNLGRQVYRYKVE